MLPALPHMPAASTGDLGHICDEGLRPGGRDVEPARWEAPGMADSSRGGPGLTKESPSLPAIDWRFPRRPKGTWHPNRSQERSDRATGPHKGGSPELVLDSQLKQLCNPRRQAEAQDLTFLAKRPQSASPEITHHYLRISSCTTGLQPLQGPSPGSRTKVLGTRQQTRKTRFSV